MKCLTILGLALLAVTASATTRDNRQWNGPKRAADETFLVRQKKVLMLLDNVLEPATDPEIEKIGEEFKIDGNIDLYKNNMVVKEFMRIWRRGMLPSGEIFSVMFRPQREEAIALFHVMYYATEWDTFYRVACWARRHINPGMFVYSMTIAVLHRADCRGMVLPPPYEIYPYYFLNGEVIQKAQVLKMQDAILSRTTAAYYGIEENDNVYTINANYTGGYLKVDREQDTLSYFTEDIGLNSYYYYFHADYPFWMGGEEYGLNRDRRGELYYHFHQQLLARYYMERLSNGLGEIPIEWSKSASTRFLPGLTYHNGMKFPMRQDSIHPINAEEHAFDLDLIRDYEGRIRDVISMKGVLMPDGSILKLESPTDMNILGNLIQGNMDSVNKRLYRHILAISRTILGGSLTPIDKNHLLPSALEHFETSLRDPLFWQMYKKLIKYFILYKNHMPAYKRDMLMFDGVQVESVQVDEMMTYFDEFKLDITTVVRRGEDEVRNNKDRKIFLAKQMRLNHEPFTIKMNVKSDKSVDSVVRVFLGPKYDSHGNLLSLHDNRFNFMEMDTFTRRLKSGVNLIERKSTDFRNVVRDRTMTRDLLKDIEAGLKGRELFLDNSEMHSGFPSRLLLPRGRRNGMPFVLLVVVSPIRTSTASKDLKYDEAVWNGVGTGARYVDSMPLGYPLDRPIENTEMFMCPNMHMMDVMIHHKTDMDRVRPVMGMHSQLDY